VPLRGDEDDVRVARVDDDASDPAGRVESHFGPRAAGVGGLVDAIPDRDMASNPWLARARPDDVRVGLRDGQGPDGLYGLIVEDRRPVDAGVHGLPDPARRRARVIRVRVAGHTGDGCDAIADRADVTPP